MNELTKTYRHAAIYGLGVVASRIVSFIMLPIYTRNLTPADYGVLELLVMTVDVVALIVGVGVSNGLFKFYYEHDEEHKRKQLVSTAFQMVLFAYSIAAVLSIYNASFFADIFFDGKYELAVQLAFGTMMFQICVSVSMAYIRAIQRPFVFVAVSLIRLVLSLSLNIYLIVIQGMGVMGAVYADVISTGIVGVILACFTFYKVGFSFNFIEMKKLYTFGAPFILTNIGAFVLTFSDRYFIRVFADLKEVGIYALGYKLGFLLSFFLSRSFNNIWEAQRFEIVKEPGFEDKFNTVLINYTFFLLLAFLGFSLLAKDFFKIMSAPAFLSAYQIVPIITLAYVLQALTTFFNFGIFYSGKSILLTRATIFAVAVVLFFSLLLIPIWGGIGAAVSTLLAFLVRLLFVYHSSQANFRINYRFNRIVKQFILAILICLIYFVTRPVLEDINSSLLVSVLFSVVFILSFIVGVFLFHLVTFPPKKLIPMLKNRNCL